MTKEKIQIFGKKDQLQVSINEYFGSCDESEGVYFTIQGLAKAIGVSAEALISMETDPNCDEKILRALTACEHQAERLLLTGDNVEFAMAQLKLLGWEDKVEVDIAFK